MTGSSNAFRIPGSAAWLAAMLAFSAGAHAQRVTQTFYMPLGLSGAAVTIGAGSPGGAGGSQYFFHPNGIQPSPGSVVEAQGDPALIPLEVGSVVDADSMFQGGATTYDFQPDFTGVSYYGLSFEIAGVNSGMPLYGYAALDGDPLLLSITYDMSGAPVTVEAAATPEPAALGFLALGAAGIARLRRRRT